MDSYRLHMQENNLQQGKQQRKICYLHCLQLPHGIGIALQ